MDEVFPVLAGIALGLATFMLRRMWLRIAVVGILGAALGAVASWISGELAVSRLYVLVDAAQVIVAALLTGALVRMWLRRRARSVAHSAGFRGGPSSGTDRRPYDLTTPLPPRLQ